MATLYIPEISAATYPEFRKICRGLVHEDHGAWRWETDKGLMDDRSSGHTIIRVVVQPAELLDYCRRHKCQCDTSALNGLATEKAQTNSEPQNE